MALCLRSAAVEVTDLHAFLEAWFRGQLPKTEAAFARLSAAWPDTLRLVSPEHRVIEAPALLAQTFEEHAACPDVRIEVRHEQCVLADGGRLAFVVYEERHVSPDLIDARFCTAVLSARPGFGLVWLHIHESRVNGRNNAA